jgi:phytoene desaturase
MCTAALLAKDGVKVTLLEKTDRVGGRASVMQRDGFIFDRGPSWYQVPEAFERFFAHFGTHPSDYYELSLLDPQYRLFVAPGEHFDFAPGTDAAADIFERVEPGSAARLASYMKIAKHQYELSMSEVVYRNMDSLADYMKPRNALKMAQFRVAQTLSGLVDATVSHPTLRKALLYPSLFVGGNPRTLPALFSLMSYVDIGIGTYYPTGGIGAFIHGLERLCREQGVDIRLSEEASSFDTHEGRVTAVVTKDSRYRADVVVSAADYPHTELDLLPEDARQYPQNHWDGLVRSPSAFVAYIGLKGRVKNLAHHNLFMPDNWETYLDDLFRKPALSPDPAFYLSVPSITDPSVAPAGCENIFVTVQIPSGITVNETERTSYFDRIIGLVETYSGESLRERILFREIFAGQDFAERYHSYRGAALGLATNFRQAMFRPRNRSTRLANLFYAGQYTSPGPGMPMCVISAEKAADRVREALRAL